MLTREDITEIRIEQCALIPDRPFSEVFITAGGETYYSRLWYPLDDTPFAREDQAQAFLRRQSAADRAPPAIPRKAEPSQARVRVLLRSGPDA
jgi:hypothetical protein